MNRTKTTFSYVSVLGYIFVIITLFTQNTFAQKYILYTEDFEKDSLESDAFIVNAKLADKVSYRGQKCVQVATAGEYSKSLNVPEKVTEIIVKGWIRVAINGKEDVSPNYQSGDTLVVTTNTYKLATISVVGRDDKNQKSVTLKEGVVGSIRRHSGWMYFEKEVKIPQGQKNIKLVCKNLVDNSIAYFDELIVEKRQLGLVKMETDWAKSVREFEEKAKRLVKNGDFEEGSSMWNPWWGFELSDIAHSGDYACMIQNPDTGAWKGTGTLKPFKIPKGTKKIRVTAWVKADNVTGGMNPWETGALLITYSDDFGNEVAGGGEVCRTVGTHEWRKYQAVFSVSERATGLNVNMNLGASTGKIYFDDILAEPMTDEEYYLASIKLTNPGFENLLSGWVTWAGKATDEAAHSGANSLLIASDEPNWVVCTQTATVERNRKIMNLGGWIKTENISETQNTWEGCRLFVEFKDINGVSVTTAEVARVIGTNDWKEYVSKIEIPEDAIQYTITFGRANVSGKAFLDDVYVTYE